jgi:hypothetical protein
MPDTENKFGNTIIVNGAKPDDTEMVAVGGMYTAKCFDANGNLRWSDEFPNLVTTQGLQYMNTQVFTGQNYNATWYIGLVNRVDASAIYRKNDTLDDHPGWVEFTGALINRKKVSFGPAVKATPSTIDNSGTVNDTTYFVMSEGDNYIAGAFLANADIGSSGVLFSVGNLVGGTRKVYTMDYIYITYTFSANTA